MSEFIFKAGDRVTCAFYGTEVFTLVANVGLLKLHNKHEDFRNDGKYKSTHSAPVLTLVERPVPTKEQIRAWVSALRSAEYSQTKGRLQNESGYCCLGVACDIFIPDEMKDLHPTTGLMIGGLPYNQGASPEWLSQIKKILGTLISGLNDYGEVSVGIEINEQFEPFTFDEIADLLEYEYIYEVLS